MFGNPVAQAVIRPPGSPVIVGSFRVTAAFGAIDDDHPTAHSGVDIGNRRCGEPLLAMATGPITLAGLIGRSLVVRGKGDDNPDHEWAIAHCASLSVKKDQRVTRGQSIGTLGMTGTTSCHAHLGCKRNGLEVDIWPLLDQNVEDDMLKGTNPFRIVNRKVSVIGTNTRFRASPATGVTPILAEYDTGAEFYPDYAVDGQEINGSVRWYAGWGDTLNGKRFGYMPETLLTPLAPIEASGHTAAELAAAASVAAAAVAAAAVSQAQQYP